VSDLTPRQIVEELDKYIIGQDDAKRAVAIALRNRWRRLRLPPEMAEEVAPKNILMIGPTGVGKTEIARRLASLARAPFIKVEASKYTEVGYHGRDVDSMIRDLVELAVSMLQAERMEEVEGAARESANERLLDLLLPIEPTPQAVAEGEQTHYERTREKLRQRLEAGDLEDRMVEVSIQEKPVVVQAAVAGMEEMGIDFQNMIERMVPSRSSTKRATVAEARMILTHEECEKLVDRDKVVGDALERVQNSGIVFLDELDKVAGRESSHGPDVSREGVQRDLLPIIEGCNVPTRYGMVRTDHVLFIAAGAFHVTKPSDLIPEIQGRFPIRVELSALGRDEFVRILKEPKNALTKQYSALLGTEDVDVEFEDDGVEQIAEIAASVNSRTQNIGARRLHTVMERLLEEISFEAPDLSGDQTVNITAEYVSERLKDIVEDEDLTRYIL